MSAQVRTLAWICLVSQLNRCHLLRGLTLAALAAFLSACATVPRLVPPEVRSVQARVVVLDFPRVRIGVDLAVFNPNARAVALSALDVDLNVEGVAVAKTSLAQPVELRALDTTQVALDASGHLGAALAGVARSLDSGNRGLRYEIVGRATLQDGTQFPFRRAGVLAYR
jgi:LEA14-like dessication related protein